MKNYLLLIHGVCLGLWLGCVLTEVLFERALLGGGPEQEAVLARLHRRVDLFIEVPAFVAVLVSGALMTRNLSPGAVLYAKIGFGLVAIAANAYCVLLVLRRAEAAGAGQWKEFSRLDHLQHRSGAVVLSGILIALSIGFYLHVAS